VTIVALCLGTATSRAEGPCLWLNAATAGGVLGGEVEMSVTPLTLVGDETCEFTRRDGASVAMLRIIVHTMEDPVKEFAAYLSQCGGSTVPLKGIGNEAVQCLSKNNSTNSEEQIIGRVRERAFILTIRRNMGNAAHGDRLRDDTRNMAEQIAGSLF
jgi:hypothetical protein